MSWRALKYSVLEMTYEVKYLQVILDIKVQVNSRQYKVRP